MKIIALIAFFFMSFALANIASAEYALEGRPGDQTEPNVWGRYIVFIENGQVMAYDLGETLSDSDNGGFYTIDSSQGNSAPAIEGRYVAWIHDRNAVRVYDMGRDKKINIGSDPGVIELDNSDPVSGRVYTMKEDLAIGGSILVWEDYDSSNGDSDIRGALLDGDSGIIISTTEPIPPGSTGGGGGGKQKLEGPYPQYFILAGVKSEEANGRRYKINEFDPDIQGENVAFARTFIDPDADIIPSNPFSEIAILNVKAIGTGNIWIRSDQNDACRASKPVFNHETQVTLAWLEECHPYNRVMYEWNEVDKALSGEKTFSSPVFFGGDIIYLVDDIGAARAYLSSDESIEAWHLAGNNHILLFTESNGNDLDIGKKVDATKRKLIINGAQSIQSVSDGSGGAALAWIDVSSSHGRFNYKFNYFDSEGKPKLEKDVSLEMAELAYVRMGETTSISFGGVQYEIILDDVISEAEGTITVNGVTKRCESYRSCDFSGIYLIPWRFEDPQQGQMPYVSFFLGTPIFFMTMATDSEGGVILAWAQGGPEGIYVAFIDPDGALIGGSPYRISDFSLLDNYNFRIMVTSNPQGEAVVIWKDTESNSYLYSIVSKDGTVWPDKPARVTGREITLKEGNMHVLNIYGFILGIEVMNIDQSGTAKLILQNEEYDISTGSFIDRSFTVKVEDINPLEKTVTVLINLPSQAIYLAPDTGEGAQLFLDIGSLTYVEKIKRSFPILLSSPPQLILYTIDAERVSEDRYFLLIASHWANYIAGRFLSKELNLWPQDPILIQKNRGSFDTKIISDGESGAIAFFSMDETNQKLYARYVKKSGELYPEKPIKIRGGENGYDAIEDGKHGAYVYFVKDSSIYMTHLQTDMNIEEALLSIPLVEEQEVEETVYFRRGDVDTDGRFTVGDAVFLLNYLFSEGMVPRCLDSADVDDDGVLTLGDAVYLLNLMFLEGSPRPPEPYKTPGPDITPDKLTCEYYPQ